MDDSDDFRGWLIMLASLTAGMTYSTALNPPGGVWQADDAANGYVAGKPVLMDKSHKQFLVFYYCNGTSFAASLCIIMLLSMPKRFSRMSRIVFDVLVALDMFCLMAAFVSGSSPSLRLGVFYATLTALVMLVFVGIQYYLGRVLFKKPSTSPGECTTIPAY